MAQSEAITVTAHQCSQCGKLFIDEMDADICCIAIPTIINLIENSIDKCKHNEELELLKRMRTAVIKIVYNQ